MLVRIFVGSSWTAAGAHRDYEFDVLPDIGHKLAFAIDDGWQAAVVTDVAHRFVDHSAAADIALLLSPLLGGGDGGAPLPVAQLDRLRDPSAPVPAPAPAGPWGGR